VDVDGVYHRNTPLYTTMHDTNALQHRIEQAGLEAWAPARTIIEEGWVVRLDAGYTNRANCATAHGVVTPPFEPRVAAWETLYRERQLPPVFRLTTIEDYTELDDFLAERGYSASAPVLVMGCPLPDLTLLLTPDPAFGMLPVGEWLPYYDHFSHKHSSQPHRAILDRITTPQYYATYTIDAEVVGVGLAVISHDNLLGLFDIVMAESVRGKGYGKALMQNLMAWGQTQGAEYAYLQVVSGNTVALRLYERLGFTEQYRYWYRR
jgi:ribosomal protein S18 acetylase RimI-like enzyme